MIGWTSHEMVLAVKCCLDTKELLRLLENVHMVRLYLFINIL